MRPKLVVGNWKMHGTQQGISDLIAGFQPLTELPDGVCVAVCPPFPYLTMVGQQLSVSPVGLGAQNVAQADGGAHTGEVAAAMLADVGCDYVIVGHSERRSLYGDTDSAVLEKVQQVLRHGMTPIVCVGESLVEREDGATLDVVGSQLQAVWQALDAASRACLVWAYEPVWAIGTGKTATPAQAQEVHAFLRGQMAADDADIAGQLPILYGGSVKAANAAELFAQSDIDGALVGGASLEAAGFLEIVKAAG